MRDVAEDADTPKKQKKGGRGVGWHCPRQRRQVTTTGRESEYIRTSAMSGAVATSDTRAPTLVNNNNSYKTPGESDE